MAGFRQAADQHEWQFLVGSSRSARHAKLVSASRVCGLVSIGPHKPPLDPEKWILKQVQDDEDCGQR
jgi:hypothetical protein